MPAPPCHFGAYPACHAGSYSPRRTPIMPIMPIMHACGTYRSGTRETNQKGLGAGRSTTFIENAATHTAHGDLAVDGRSSLHHEDFCAGGHR